MGDFAPLMVDGSFGYAEQIRRLTWMAAGGDYGRAGFAALLVQATSPASAQVTISVGSGVMMNPGGLPSSPPFADALAGQAYSVTATAPVSVTVPANVSGAAVVRRLWLVATDPQYASSGVSADPTFVEDYVNVTWTTGAGSVPATVAPMLWLADISLPASTATVTAAMITPNPRIVNPRTSVVMLSGMVWAADSVVTTSDGRTQNFPRYCPTVAVPAWASSVRVIAASTNIICNNIGGTKPPAFPAPPSNGTSRATLRMQWGGTLRTAISVPDPAAQYGQTMQLAEDGADAYRKSVTVGGAFDCSAQRGQNVMVAVDFGATAQVVGSSNPWQSLVAETGVTYQVFFSEMAL